MPPTAFGWQKREGAYYCTVKFAGGLEYNNALKQWQGAVLKLSRNFVMKLTFHQTLKVQTHDRDEYDKGQTESRDEYDVTITEEGDGPVSCLENGEKLPSINKYAFLECSRMGLIEYKFNFINHRFIEIYKGGYINGADDNNDTPQGIGRALHLSPKHRRAKTFKVFPSAQGPSVVLLACIAQWQSRRPGQRFSPQSL